MSRIKNLKKRRKLHAKIRDAAMGIMFSMLLATCAMMRYEGLLYKGSLIFIAIDLVLFATILFSNFNIKYITFEIKHLKKQMFILKPLDKK